VYVSTSLRDVFSFTFLIVLLLFRPSGLFGKTLEEKV
jgi:branched-subunit amino acid ABC-type transport system permease component